MHFIIYALRKSLLRPSIYLFSIILLILSGHYFAVWVTNDQQTAWIWVAVFYGVWMIGSILLFSRKADIHNMFKRGSFQAWLLIPILFATVALFGIFVPNAYMFKWDSLLLMNVVICLVNPFLEEVYWRGLPSNLFNNKPIQYIIASVGFAAGHPLILGVNSKGASGWQTFVGAFILGSCWWLYYNNRRSLRWPVFTHFLIDLFGMAAYLLADKLPLLL